MAYKAACAGLDLGGGKAVIIGDPTTDKSEALLRAYGRFVQAVGGRYYTACDVGTYVEDMDVVARECSFVTGRSPAHGGAGDSSILTAYGVFQGMRAAAAGRLGLARPCAGGGSASPASARSGTTWSSTCSRTARASIVADVAQDAVDRVRLVHPEVDAVAPDALIDEPMDVYAPCALGAALSDETVPRLSAQVVCGAANNQLAHPGIEKLLEERGVLYAPDYVVNSGGLIQVADEIEGYIEARARLEGDRDLRHHAAHLRAGRGRGRPAVGGCRPARRAQNGADRRPAPGLASHSVGQSRYPEGDSASPDPPSRIRPKRTGSARGTRGSSHMGRGRAKAKQTKVARQLKYSSGGTDLDRLQEELAAERGEHLPDQPASEPSATTTTTATVRRTTPTRTTTSPTYGPTGPARPPAVPSC